MTGGEERGLRELLRLQDTKSNQRTLGHSYCLILAAGAAVTGLRLLNAAVRLENLLVPPGNKLEALKGGRQGQHSIRINRQWRICFRWSGGNAHNVEIVDYH